MPTQEERIAALEQKTAAHIQEMDENFTIMVGVIRHQGQDIKRIFQRLETMDENLLTVNQRLATVNESLHTVNQRLATVDENLLTANQRLDTMDENLLTVNQRLATVDESLHTFRRQLDEHTSLLTQILERLT